LVVFKDDTYKKLKGRIPIEGCLVEIAPEAKYHRKFCFEVTGPLLRNKVFVFVAANATLLQEWMTSIRRAMLKLRRDRTKTVDKDGRRPSVNQGHNNHHNDNNNNHNENFLSSSPKISHTPLSTSSTDEKFGVYIQWLEDAKSERRTSIAHNPPPQSMDQFGNENYLPLEEGQSQQDEPTSNSTSNKMKQGCVTCLNTCASSLNNCAYSIKRKCVIL